MERRQSARESASYLQSTDCPGTCHRCIYQLEIVILSAGMRLTVFIALVGCGRLGFRENASDAAVDASDWWDQAFAFRNRVIVHSTRAPEREDKFPVSIRLRPPAVDAAV